MAALWGSTLVVMKGAYARMSPENLLACRFALAAAAFGVFFPKAWRTDTRTIVKGAILGVLFAGGQLLQSIGLSSTQAATNGFIASLYVVFTPLLAAVIFRKKVSRAVWGAVGLATVGMGVLALDPSSLSSGFGGIGQLLTLASALAYAGHIVATGRFANPSNVASLGLYQTITVAIVCTIAALPTGLSVPTHMQDWLALAYLAIICGTLTTFMQSWGQARVESTRAAVIMCTEPLWGAVFAIGFGGETLTARIIIGGMAILAAMALVVCPPRRRRGVSQPHSEPPASQVDPAWAPRFGMDRML
ncbi:DMT family transporter [Cutibacterium equinum]|uniref:DMT family transporter n=1 Tax=Cutibacterium equinum TaxID=3016342 RepID=A0ABY7R0U8_9ACTN|nr:DMT family transporter [Cutibacterium equinum]WCC80555.1 DMT family transporter [Cutibacterium equinum]